MKEIKIQRQGQLHEHQGWSKLQEPLSTSEKQLQVPLHEGEFSLFTLTKPVNHMKSHNYIKLGDYMEGIYIMCI